MACRLVWMKLWLIIFCNRLLSYKDFLIVIYCRENGVGLWWSLQNRCAKKSKTIFHPVLIFCIFWIPFTLSWRLIQATVWALPISTGHKNCFTLLHKERFYVKRRQKWWDSELLLVPCAILFLLIIFFSIESRENCDQNQKTSTTKRVSMEMNWEPG